MWLRGFIILIWLAGSAFGGAWPQEKGSGFAAASVRLVWPKSLQGPAMDRYSTVYMEYGLTERVTVGLDLGHAVSGAVKRIAFARMPVLRRDPWIVSSQVGFGTIAGRRVIRPSLAVGRGTEGRHGYGWITAEASVELDLNDLATDMKLDVTYGMALPKQRKLILQLQTGVQAGDQPFARFAPSVVWPLRGRMSLETGVTLGLTPNTGYGVMLGLWTSF